MQVDRIANLPLMSIIHSTLVFGQIILSLDLMQAICIIVIVRTKPAVGAWKVLIHQMSVLRNNSKVKYNKYY